MQTIPDSNVVLDVFSRDSTWLPWSAKMLAECRVGGRLVINPIVFAEVAMNFHSYADLKRHVSALEFELEEVPWEAAYKAGRAHRAYRSAGGNRTRVLPDFLIGAHAALKGYRILTRDQARYRTYFPELHIIAPDSHP